VLRFLAPFLLPVFLSRKGTEEGAGNAFFLLPPIPSSSLDCWPHAWSRRSLVCIYIYQRDPRVRVAQKFLRRFEVYACCPKIGGKRVAKAMPPDCFVLDSGPRHCGADDFLEQRIRGQRLFSFKSNRGKEEIVVARIGGLSSRLQGTPLRKDGEGRVCGSLQSSCLRSDSAHKNGGRSPA
jgi:hypothetical protein